MFCNFGRNNGCRFRPNSATGVHVERSCNNVIIQVTPKNCSPAVEVMIMTNYHGTML